MYCVLFLRISLYATVRCHWNKRQLYVTCSSLCRLACKRPVVQRATLQKLEACIAEIRQWLPLNSLELNKTEILLIQFKMESNCDHPLSILAPITFTPLHQLKTLLSLSMTHSFCLLMCLVSANKP